MDLERPAAVAYHPVLAESVRFGQMQFHSVDTGIDAVVDFFDITAPDYFVPVLQAL